MIPALKAEFRKLLTVRSTYVIPLIAYALLAFVSFYIEGYKNGKDNTSGPLAGSFLSNSLVQHASVLSVFGAIVALLLLAHEYRYNTIMYSLTIVNRRSKVLLGKIITIIIYTVVFVLIGDAIGLAGITLGAHFAGVSIPHQNLALLEYFIKSLVFCEGWALAGMLFVALLRNQVAAIVVLFVVPSTVESLLGLLLKENAKYLPFMALSQVVAVHFPGEVTLFGTLTPVQGALIFLAYLSGVWAIAWVLFLKRDAN